MRMAAVIRLPNAPCAQIVASSGSSSSSSVRSSSRSSAGLRCRGQSRSNVRLLTLTVPQSPSSSQQTRNQLCCFAQAGAQPAASDAVTVQVEVPQVQLGSSGVSVPVIGVGAWAWGDKFQWNDGDWNERKAADAKSAFNTSLELGLNFIDTAEVYGKAQFGSEDSETLLGRFIKEREQKKEATTAIAIVATKFAALPWRFGRAAVVDALKTSLQKLQLDSVDLYQLHWPGLWGNEGYIDGLADCVELGLAKAVGVSNYNEQRLRNAHKQLASRGVPLASNQVHYNILYRIPEQNGVKAACDELGVTLIAYSPLAQGILSGKYSVERPPTGPRAASYSKEFLVQIQPVLSRMRELGAKHGDRTLVQVALNWLVTQGNVVPIPGAKSQAQVEEFKGALGWSLAADEVEELRQLASKIPPVVGFPAERL